LYEAVASGGTFVRNSWGCHAGAGCGSGLPAPGSWQ
jgi:hypothetical protein